ncbi:hypothetical protein ACM43_11630 [Bradyrhizobium sp. CCBAU 45321]|nr:hypothetical protein [Bradyrhizobium sp. CCBAU 45321]
MIVVRGACLVEGWGNAACQELRIYPAAPNELKVRWKVLVAWQCEAANAIAEILQARDLIAAM